MAKAKREKTERAKVVVRDLDVEIPLVPVVALLHENVTAAMCGEVFGELRTSERERKLSLFALARFWLSVILEAPASLSQQLERARRRPPEGFLPEINVRASSFFEKCQNFSSVFFDQLHRRFVESILPEIPKRYAQEVAHLQKKFRDVFVIDGSRLGKVAHRLKILWPEKAAVLPGSILAIYDLFRGIARQVWFDADAASAEFNRAHVALQLLEEGTLVMGDRLYCSLELFGVLGDAKCFGVFRKTKSVSTKAIEVLARVDTEGGLLEDVLVKAGKGDGAMTLRLVRLTREGKTYEALTNVLDPERLSAKDIVTLYPLRWSVERLFYDLKVVLNLERFHAANPNAVAMQVYAAVMVHAALRVAQAQIAQKAKIKPEELSPAKLFPLLALVSMMLIEAEYYFERICEANQGVKLRKPNWHDLPGSIISLRYLLVQRRTGPRKRRKFHPDRKKWKSFTRVRGGKKLT